MLFSWSHKDKESTLQVKIYLRRFYTVTKKNKTCVNVTWISIAKWVLVKRKILLIVVQKPFRPFFRHKFPPQKRKAQINLNIPQEKETRFCLHFLKKTCSFEVCPKSISQCFYFFTSIWLKAFKEFLSKFLHFLWINLLFCSLKTLQQYETSRRNRWAEAMHRVNHSKSKANKNCWGINHCLL